MIAKNNADVLVVDDDSRIRHLLAKYLTNNGYRVTCAADAAEARRKISAIAFDVLVLDVMMPGEDGLTLTESLRRDLATAAARSQDAEAKVAQAGARLDALIARMAPE